MGEASVDNLDCSEGELDFWDMSWSGSLALKIGSSVWGFDMVELGLDTQERVFGSSTACYHTWEQHSGRR